MDTRIHTSLPMPSTVRQIDGLQILRAVAVLLVTWFHAGQLLAPLTKKSLPDCGAYGVDIFFVISGFIVSSVVLRIQSEPGLKTLWSFLSRRIIRIFPIYWIFAIPQTIRLIRSHEFVFGRFMSALLLWPGHKYGEVFVLVAPGWTLIFEMFFYYVIALILAITVRRAVPTLIALLCCAVIVAGGGVTFENPF